VSVRIPDRTFFRIGDVSAILGVKPHVIRFWEGEFPFLAPEKAASGQRVYRRSGIEALLFVRHLLHVERYSIEGAKKKLTELRRTSGLRDAIDRMLEQDQAVEATPVLTVGSTVSKDKVTALRIEMEELRRLIRNPALAGLKLSGSESLQ
jgi:DNA-binding transcriptional MerR regulator